jgi:hypothetical protein
MSSRSSRLSRNSSDEERLLSDEDYPDPYGISTLRERDTKVVQPKRSADSRAGSVSGSRSTSGSGRQFRKEGSKGSPAPLPTTGSGLSKRGSPLTRTDGLGDAVIGGSGRTDGGGERNGSKGPRATSGVRKSLDGKMGLEVERKVVYDRSSEEWESYRELRCRPLLKWWQSYVDDVSFS